VGALCFVCGLPTSAGVDVPVQWPPGGPIVGAVHDEPCGRDFAVGAGRFVRGEPLTDSQQLAVVLGLALVGRAAPGEAGYPGRRRSSAADPCPRPKEPPMEGSTTALQAPFALLECSQLAAGDAIYVPGWGPLAVEDVHGVRYAGSPEGNGLLITGRAMLGDGEQFKLLRGPWESVTAYKGGARAGRFGRSP